MRKHQGRGTPDRPVFRAQVPAAGEASAAAGDSASGRKRQLSSF